MEKPTARWINGLVFFLILGTATHLGYRWYGSVKSSPSGVSEVQAGSRFPSLTLVAVNKAAHERPFVDEQTCAIVVFFSPDCTHCHAAAMRDAAIKDTNALPVTWVAGGIGSDVTDFASLLTHGAKLYTSPDAHDLLEVRAVPAAFLVSGGIVRLVFPYQGQDVVPRSRWDGYCQESS